MAAKTWDDGNSHWNFSNKANWESPPLPKLSFWMKMRFWLAEKLIGKNFIMEVRAPIPQSPFVELTSKDEIIFNGSGVPNYSNQPCVRCGAYGICGCWTGAIQAR